jgi:hypothetical protein
MARRMATHNEFFLFNKFFFFNLLSLRKGKEFHLISFYERYIEDEETVLVFFVCTSLSLCVFCVCVVRKIDVFVILV